ncbi:MAG: hypothetical protein O3B24_03100 [Verrucomicrobia bacterium]|nr:hypothetical protein [Verrucomicrobiota bacterium]
MSGSKLEIICGACGEDALLRREPVFEGFKKTGERLSCSACGHVYDSEDEVPFKASRRAQVFTDADRTVDVAVFREEERARCCRYCVNYVINPFTQWCSLHRRDVEATDICDQFKRKPPEKPPEKPKDKPVRPL